MSTGLEIRLWWGDHLVGEHFFRSGVARKLTVGAGKDADFPVFGIGSHEIIRGDGHGLPTVHFTQAMNPELHRPGAAPVALNSDDEGLTLASGDIVTLQLGSISAEVRARAAAKRVFVPFTEATDFRFANVVLATFAVALFFILTANTYEPPDGSLDDVISATKIAVRIIRVEPPKPAPARASASASGATKSPSAPIKREAAKPAGPHLRSARDVLASLNMNANALIGPSASDVIGAAMGQLQVAHAGNSVSGVGIGALRGGNEPGPHVIGLGGIRTKGRDDRGVGMLKRLTGPGPEMALTSEAEVVGNLDPDLIRSVIHANRGQIRYCYEHLLNQHPNLAGKVAVHFIISANGSVSASNVQLSTTSNAQLDNCVAGRVRTWKFPQPKGGGIAVVTYPFLFKQSGQ